MKNLIGDCTLCGEHSLHIYGESGARVMQCVSCGYTSTSKFTGNKEDNEEYKKLTDEMRGWVKESKARFWIPTIMTLPTGMLYPKNIEVVCEEDSKKMGITVVDYVMKWAFAQMVDIPEDERENYPDGMGGHYKSRYDTDNAKIFDVFIEAMAFLTQSMKEKDEDRQTKVE